MSTVRAVSAERTDDGDQRPSTHHSRSPRPVRICSHAKAGNTLSTQTARLAGRASLSWVDRVRQPTVIRALRRWFPDLGVPTQLVTDGGPQFASRQFADCCSRWQIDHVTSTPHYPQSNGHAEAACEGYEVTYSEDDQQWKPGCRRVPTRTTRVAEHSSRRSSQPSTEIVRPPIAIFCNGTPQ